MSNDHTNLGEYQEISVNSLEEIYRLIDEYKTDLNLPRKVADGTDPDLQLFFRGQSDASWDIEPSILHSNTIANKNRTATIHQIMIDKKCSLFEATSRYQHYNEGTRLIDFTTCKDVALYFACCDQEEKDAAFFMYSYAPHRGEWTTAIVMSALEEIIGCGKLSVRQFAEYIFANYQDISQKYQYVDELCGNIISFLDSGFMVLPEYNSSADNLRVVRQSGCFYMPGVHFLNELCPQNRWFSQAGNNIFTACPVYVSNDFRARRWLLKIIIPHELKKHIINHLAHIGITKETLFPADCDVLNHK